MARSAVAFPDRTTTSPPPPSPAKLSDTRGLASMLRTRGLCRLYMRTDSPPSQRNQTGMGTGAPAGVTVVIQTTMSSRRWRATRAPNSVPSSTTLASCRGRRRLARRRLALCRLLRCDRSHVVLELGARRGLLPDVAVGHVPALGDQVHQDSEERQEDHEDAPGGLGPAADVVPPEDVREDPEQDQEPREPEEEDEHGPEDVHERIVSCDQHGASLEPRRVIRNHPYRVTA